LLIKNIVIASLLTQCNVICKVVTQCIMMLVVHYCFRDFVWHSRTVSRPRPRPW